MTKKVKKSKAKKTRVRNKKYINSPEAIAELDKFINFCGNLRNAALKMGITSQNIYTWRLNNVLIPESRATFMAETAGLCKDLLLKRSLATGCNAFNTLKELINHENMPLKVKLSEMTTEEIYNKCLSDELINYINDVRTINTSEKMKEVSKMLSAIFGNRPSKWVKDIKFLLSLK